MRGGKWDDFHLLPTLWLRHGIKRSRSTGFRIEFDPFVSDYIPENPTDFVAKSFTCCAQTVPGLHLSGQFSRWCCWGNWLTSAQSFECIAGGWTNDQKRVFSAVQRHGLQPRQQTPCVIKVTVRKAYNVNFSCSQGNWRGLGFEAFAVICIPGLKPFAGVDDSNTIFA